jgi:hypothetical protein
MALSQVDLPENLEQDQGEKEVPQVDAELLNHRESPLI